MNVAMAHENSTGANIYVAANPLRSGSRKRTKESIASLRSATPQTKTCLRGPRFRRSLRDVCTDLAG